MLSALRLLLELESDLLDDSDLELVSFLGLESFREDLALSDLLDLLLDSFLGLESLRGDFVLSDLFDLILDVLSVSSSLGDFLVKLSDLDLTDVDEFVESALSLLLGGLFRGLSRRGLSFLGLPSALLGDRLEVSDL